MGGDNGLYGVDRSNLGTDFSVELETLNDSHLDTAREVGHPDGISRGSASSDPAFRDIQHSHLHSGESFDFLRESGAEVDGSASDSLRTRLTRLRRTIGDGFLSKILA